VLGYRRVISFVVCVVLFSSLSLVWAAPKGSTFEKLRYSQNQERVRIVFDFDSLPEYNAVLEEKPLRLIIEINGAIKNGVSTQMLFNDPFVKGLVLEENGPSHIRAIIDLRQFVTHNVFLLKDPNRLVIDLGKVFDQKIDEEVMPGITHTSWIKSYSFGPVESDVLTIFPESSTKVVPVLSDGVINGIEPLSKISSRVKAIAAINGSYFSQTGEIIGLLKLNGKIVSTPTIPRSALGIRPDGSIFIDQVEYHGQIELAGGDTININGVNRERYTDEIILYNEYYGATTATNNYGTDVVINDKGIVTAITNGNTPLVAGYRVISGHGQGQDALKKIAIGDHLVVTETLGDEWDKTVYALGAGPMLVKDGNVFLTTQQEEFGPDVAAGRAPRTALGVTKDGAILLVVVDGRRQGSAGLSLAELAVFMKDIGAVNALNLDGGGSSEMIIHDTVVNKPSDGRERKIGDGLAIIESMLVN